MKNDSLPGSSKLEKKEDLLVSEKETSQYTGQINDLINRFIADYKLDSEPK